MSVAEGGLVQISCSWPARELQARAAVLRDMRVMADFISEGEEAALMAELQPYLAKMRYEYDHWDNVSSLTDVLIPILYRRNPS